jgi:predicted NAD-dependent protein-ADP-ribosyltransferase YbiA (DUF1768 family)
MILFYAPQDPFGAFSNFSRHQVSIYDTVWPTSEHPFQAMKFWPHRPDLVEKVRQAKSPGKAALIGRNTSNPLRADWDSRPSAALCIRAGRVLVLIEDGINRAGGKAEPLFARGKDVFMYEIVLAKFQQHELLRELLLGTGDQAIVEDAMADPYWGWGPSKVGQNKLGRILMLVRDILRVES